MSYKSRFVAAVVGMLVMAIVASRQLFLFTVLRDAQGLMEAQGGRYHLWLALSAGVTACVAAGLMFYFFRRLDYEGPKVSRVAIATPLTASSGRRSNNSIYWEGPSPWLLEGQADDRTPMNGSVADSGGSEAEQRAYARRSHQIMFKKWSQERHY